MQPETEYTENRVRPLQSDNCLTLVLFLLLLVMILTLAKYFSSLILLITAFVW